MLIDAASSSVNKYICWPSLSQFGNRKQGAPALLYVPQDCGSTFNRVYD